MSRLPALLFLLILYVQSVAQLVTSDPQFPLDTDEVIITFDATKGTAGLAGYTGDVYAHTGVITENSNSPGDWKYVKTNWGENTPETRLTKIATDLYQLVISPSIREYYGVPDGEEILKLAFVFRSADASREGKADGGADIFIDLNTGFVLLVNSPTQRYDFYSAEDSVTLSLSTPESTVFTYYQDGKQVDQSTGTDYQYSHPVIADSRVHELVVTAISVSQGDSLGYRHTYIVDPVTTSAPAPVGTIDGINYGPDDTRVTLQLVAPGKENIFVIGDFNDWSLDLSYQMFRDEDRFWVTINGLEPGQEYVFQYLVDGGLIVADPYTEKVISQYDDAQIIAEGRYPGLKPYPAGMTRHEASVIQTARPEYQWEVTDFVKPAKEDLVVYELLVRDFTEERTYQAVIDRMDYLDSLGINAVHLMPVTEFEGNISWGYNPAFMFAPDKYYGTENDLKRLVDEFHKRGIAVIFDIVLNHQFGRSPLVRLYNEGDFGPPTSDNPWFNTTPRHDYNVGYDMNHESPYTQDFVDRVVTYWIEEYKADGYRFDLSKGFTQKNTLGNVGAWGQYDASRIALLKRMADVMWSVDPDSYVILEHFAENVEEVELADYGMMLWGNQNGTYIATGLGNASDLGWGYHKNRGWQEPNLMAYMESHDEERVFYEVSTRSAESTYRQYQRMMQNAAFFFAIPGPKLMWQFGEFGYDEELNNDRLGIKPTRWEYLEDTARLRLLSVYQAMINLKTQTQYLDDRYFEWKPDGEMKWLLYDHPDVKIAIFGNFSRVTQTFSRDFMPEGTWYHFLTGQRIEITDNEPELAYGPGVFQIFTSEPIDNYISEGTEQFLLGTDDNGAHEWVLYPNPTMEVIHLSAGEIPLEYRLFDSMGRMVKAGTMKDSKLDVRWLKGGWYVLQVTDGDTVKRYKFIRK